MESLPAHSNISTTKVLAIRQNIMDLNAIFLNFDLKGFVERDDNLLEGREELAVIS